MHSLELALKLILDPSVLAVIGMASTLGVIIGATPGLTAVMGTALLVPVTFFMEPVPAIAAIVAMAAMAIFAGDIPGALVRIPGTPASAAYVDEAYQLTRQGRPELALGVCMGASCIGGLLGTVVLVIGSPVLAEFALSFSSVEYFWLGLLGLTCAAFVSPGNIVKGVASLAFGLFLGTIGVDIMAGHPRFTFGLMELMGGIGFIPVLIGMFALPEILRNLDTRRPRPTIERRLGRIFEGLGSILWHQKVNVLRGASIGTCIGALPGAGADIAAWVGYAISRRTSKTPEKFGTGHVEGIVEATASNNAALSGAWVPALVFGIPGDSITAIAIGVLFLKGMEPGPTIFTKQPHLLYAVFIAFFIANLLLIPLGYLVIRFSSYLLRVPDPVLFPIILMCCVVGAFAINNTVFGVGVMLCIGLVGYLMEENEFPLAPAILGMVLGDMVEFNFMTTMIKAKGDFAVFFSRPIAATLGIVTLMIWLSPLGIGLWRRYRSQAADSTRRDAEAGP
jgi:TctA family transporter